MLSKETWPHYKGDVKGRFSFCSFFAAQNMCSRSSDGVQIILKQIHLTETDDQYQFGKTKIFIRQPEWVPLRTQSRSLGGSLMRLRCTN